MRKRDLEDREELLKIEPDKRYASLGEVLEVLNLIRGIVNDGMKMTGWEEPVDEDYWWKVDVHFLDPNDTKHTTYETWYFYR